MTTEPRTIAKPYVVTHSPGYCGGCRERMWLPRRWAHRAAVNVLMPFAVGDRLGYALVAEFVPLGFVSQSARARISCSAVRPSCRWMAETDNCLYVGHDQLPDCAEYLNLAAGRYNVAVDYRGDGDIDLSLVVAQP